MDNRNIIEIISTAARRRRLKKWIALMSAVVLFVTTNRLVLFANALEPGVPGGAIYEDDILIEEDAPSPDLLVEDDGQAISDEIDLVDEGEEIEIDLPDLVGNGLVQNDAPQADLPEEQAISGDLRDFIDDARLVGTDEVPAWNVVQGETYTLRLHFSEGNEMSFDRQELHYALPEGVAAAADFGETSGVYGEYVVEDGSKLTVRCVFEANDSDFSMDVPVAFESAGLLDLGRGVCREVTLVEAASEDLTDAPRQEAQEPEAASGEAEQSVEEVGQPAEETEASIEEVEIVPEEIEQPASEEEEVVSEKAEEPASEEKEAAPEEAEQLATEEEEAAEVTEQHSEEEGAASEETEQPAEESEEPDIPADEEEALPAAPEASVEASESVDSEAIDGENTDTEDIDIEDAPEALRIEFDLSEAMDYPLSMRALLGDAIVDVDAALLPVACDAELVAVETIEDDYLVTPVADFDAAVIEIGPHAVTLLNYRSAPAYPAQSFTDSTDYVTVSVTADAGAFPAGTTMTLADIDDAGTIDGITEKVEEDFVKVERVHAVDITFRDADGNEIEPLIPISVVMTVREIEDDLEAMVVHVDTEGEAQVVEDAAPAGEAEAPASSSVEFTADSFSVYAVVVAQKIETKVIAADGKTYRIEVTYAEDADIPAGATLSVAEVTGEEAYLEQAKESIDKYIALARFFDIKIMNDGEEVRLGAPVEVRVWLDEADVAEDATPVAVHFAQTGVETQEAHEADDAVVFRAEGFSVWGVAYTVDFHYDGYTQRMAGGSSVLLSQVFEWMHIAEDVLEVREVVFSDPSLLEIRQVSGVFHVDDAVPEVGEGYTFDAGAGDWLLTSLAPFTSNETLTVTMRSGVKYIIEVTDSQDIANINDLLIGEALIVNGKEVKKGETAYVRDGITYTLKLKFKENTDFQFDTSQPLTFDLPEGFMVPEGFTTTLEISLGKRGKLYCPIAYNKDTHQLEITWDESNPALFEYFKEASTATLSIDLQGTVDLQKGQIKFSDSGVINLVKEDLHNAKVLKMGEYREGEMFYTVVVESDGTTNDLVMTDEPGIALLYKDDCTLDTESSYSVPGEENSWANNTPACTIEHVGGTYRVHIPSMADGERLVFKYSCEIEANNIQMLGSATFDETGNTVTISGDAIPEDNVSTYWQDVVPISEMEKDVDDKGVSTVYQDALGNAYRDIPWVIKANDTHSVSFADTYITDTIDESVQEMCEYTGTGITVYVYDLENNLVATRQVSWADMAVDITQDKSWSYHIPETDTLPYKYVVKYNTRINQDMVDSGGKDVYVANYAVSKGGMDAAMEIIHPRGEGLGVSKRAKSYTIGDVDTNPVTMGTVEWEMTVTMPQGFAGNCQLLTEMYATSVDALANPQLKDSSGNPLVKCGLPSQWVDPSQRKEIYKSVEIVGLQDDESYEVVSTDMGKWKSDLFEIQFFKVSQAQLETMSEEDRKTVRGLHDAEEGSRSITVRLKTEYDPSWITDAQAQQLHGGAYNHINIVDVGNYYSGTEKRNPEKNSGARAVDKITPRGTHTAKRVLRSYKNIIDENKKGRSYNFLVRREDGKLYPVILFQVAVTGVTTDEPLVITDKFDTDVFELWTEKGEKYTNVNGGEFWTYYYPKFGAYDTGDWISDDMKWYSSTYPYSTPADQYNTTVELLDDGARFTIGKVPTKPNGSFYNVYLVEYFLTPKNEEALKEIARRALLNGGQGGEAVFVNTATSRGISDDARFEIPVTDDYAPVSKSMEQRIVTEGGQEVKTNTVDCEVRLNPGKLRLNDGVPMYVTDTYSKTLAVDFDSVRFETDPECEISYDFSDYTGTFLIPDETSVTIRYQATIQGDGSSTTISNTAAMLKFSDTAEMSVTFDATPVGAIEHPEIVLYKYGAGHMEQGLEGAEFQLYEVSFANYPPTSEDDYRYTPATATEAKGGGEIVFTTKENGKIEIKLEQDKHGKNLQFSDFETKEENGTLRIDWESTEPANVHMYALKEIKPPEGYVAADFFYRFCIVRDGKEGDKVHLPIYADYVFTEGDMMTARNSKETTELTITKTFAGNAAEDLADDEKNAITFSVVNADGSHIKTTAADSDKLVDDARFLNIPYSEFKDGQYHLTGLAAGSYKIIESHAEPGEDRVGWTLETTYAWNGMEGDTVVISANDIKSGETYEASVVNTYTEPEVDLEVHKNWQTTTGFAMAWPGTTEVTIDLYTLADGELTPVMAGDEQVSVTLDGVKDNQGEDRAGVAVFKKLPQLPEGTVYAVKEHVAVDGYTIVYPNEGEYSTFTKVAGVDTATIVNKQESTSVSVSKLWKQTKEDTANNPPMGATAVFRLYSYAEGADASTARRVTTVNDITLDGAVDESGEAAEWTATFVNLPLRDKQGNALVYIVREQSCADGFQPDYPEGQDYATDKETITNRPATVHFGFRKVWQQTPNNSWPENEEIEVTVKRRNAETKAVDDTFEAKYKLTTNGCELEGTQPVSWDDTPIVAAWDATTYAFSLSDLVKKGPDGDWEYYAVETPEADYTTEYYLNGVRSQNEYVVDGGQIYNTGKLVTVSFTKEWYGASLDERETWPANHAITVQLTRKFRYQDGSETVTAPTDPTGFGYTYVISDGGATIATSPNPNGGVGTMEKVGENTGGGDTVASYGRYAVSNLPRYERCYVNGVLRFGEWQYAFTEIEVKNGDAETNYRPAYAVDGDNTVIRNLQIETTDVTVNKTWLDGETDYKLALSNPVRLKLYHKVDTETTLKVGDDYYAPATDLSGAELPPVEITAADSWTHTFNGLRKYVDGTTPEVYIVREEAVKIDGEWTENIGQYYEVTYPEAGNGLTVNNKPQDSLAKTSVSVSKVWADHGDHSEDEVTVRLYRAVNVPNDADVLNVNVRLEWYYSDGSPAPPLTREMLNGRSNNQIYFQLFTSDWGTRYLPFLNNAENGGNLWDTWTTGSYGAGGGHFFLVQQAKSIASNFLLNPGNGWKDILDIDPSGSTRISNSGVVNKTVRAVYKSTYTPPEGILAPSLPDKNVLPENAVQTQYVQTLSSKNGWGTTFTGLPTTECGYPVTYYVVEESVKTKAASVSAAYSHTGNSWTITNTPTYAENLEIDKSWLKVDGESVASEADVHDYRVTFDVLRKEVNQNPGAKWLVSADASGADEGTWVSVGEYTVAPSQADGSASNGAVGSPTFDAWKVNLTQLPVSAGGKNYVYKVVEKAVRKGEDAKDVSTFNPTYAVAGNTVEVKNTLANAYGYSLPATGGPGTTPYTAIGALLVLLATALLVARKRKD